MKLTRSLALLSLGLLMASANATTRYNGTWSASSGESGTLSMDLYGSLISGSLTRYWPSTVPIVTDTARMSGSFTGHRFKLVVTFDNGGTASYQGNIKFDGNHIRMDGLRYFGDRPDVKARIRIDADWVPRS